MAAPAPKPQQKKRLSGFASHLVWGSLAICAVVGVSVVIALGIGASRGGFGVVQTTTRPPAVPIVQKPAVSEFEIARLTDALRALSADRDRLADRVDQLERSMGDITASISTVKERAASSPPPAPQPPAAASMPAKDIGNEPIDKPTVAAAPPGAIAQSAPPVTVQATQPAAELEPAKPTMHPRVTRPGQIASRPPQAPRAPKPAPQPQTLQTTLLQPFQPAPPPAPPAPAAPKGPPTQVAQIMPATANAAAGSGTTKTEFAVDLGGEMSIDGLRARWANIKGSNTATLDGLRPLVSVREGVKPGTVELRLIAGPMQNAGDAAKVCASLQTKGIACRATEFDGQRLR